MFHNCENCQCDEIHHERYQVQKIDNDSGCVVINKLRNLCFVPEPPHQRNGNKKYWNSNSIAVEAHHQVKVEDNRKDKKGQGEDGFSKGAQEKGDVKSHKENIDGDEDLFCDQRGKELQQRVSDQVKAQIRDGMQFIGKKNPPFFAAMEEIIQDHQVINVARSILSGEIRQHPNQPDVGGEKQGI